MTLPRLESNYNAFAVSGALSSAQITAIANSDTLDLSTATLSGGVLSLGGQTVTMYDIRSDVETFRDNATFADITRSPASVNVVRHLQGREDWEGTLVFTPNTTTNHTYDLLIKDIEGIRVLYAHKWTDKILVAVCSIFERPQEVDVASGGTTYTCTFRNSGLVTPVWR